MKAHALAVLAALAVQPVVFLCWFVLPFVLTPGAIGEGDWLEILGMIVYVLIFAAAHLALLGLPAFFLLKHLKYLSWPTILLAGFVSGSVVMAALGWPLRSGQGFSYSENWHGELRHMIVAGVPTFYGWLSYVEGVLLYGLQGLTGAAAFYWTWKRYAT